MSEEDNDESLDSRKGKLLMEAVLEFGFRFSEYVREMDPDMWRRARDYAKDWTQVEGVEFTESGGTGDEDHSS